MSLNQPVNAPSTRPVELPAVVRFRQVGSVADGWSDHYGAMQVAAAYCGLTLAPHFVLGGIWHHGCIGPWYEYSPDPLLCHAPGAGQRPLYVARQEQADYLHRHGHTKARAIGLPILYTPAPKVSRIPGSLLVVPTHTLVGDSFPDRTAFERYADEIHSIAGQFSRVVVCVHPNCRKNGLWVKEFSERGFEIIYGAETNDANALLRIRTLFSQFETLTTNGWGSHVAYALAVGTRVSIHGTELVRSKADYLRDNSWAANTHSLQQALSDETKRKQREFLQAHQVPPGEAVADRALGEWLVGAKLMLPPEEMKEVLAGLVVPREVTVADQRREQRRLVRAEAARLVANHRKAEALQLLLRLVREAAATRHPHFILETLREVSADMQSLDSARAAQLQEQARLLTERIVASRRTAA